MSKGYIEMGETKVCVICDKTGAKGECGDMIICSSCNESCKYSTLLANDNNIPVY